MPHNEEHIERRTIPFTRALTRVPSVDSALDWLRRTLQPDFRIDLPQAQQFPGRSLLTQVPPGAFPNTPGRVDPQSFFSQPQPSPTAASIDPYDRDALLRKYYPPSIGPYGGATSSQAVRQQFDIYQGRLADAAAMLNQMSSDLMMPYRQQFDTIDMDLRHAAQTHGLQLEQLNMLQGRVREQYGMESQFLADQIRRQEDRYRLALEELNLRAAGLTADMQRALEGQARIVVNEQALARAFTTAEGMAQPHIQTAIQAAEGITAAGVEKVGTETLAAVRDAFARAESEGVGGSAAEQAALSGIISEQQGLLSGIAQRAGQHDVAITEAMGREAAAVIREQASAFAAGLAGQAAVAGAEFAVKKQQAKEQLEDLELIKRGLQFEQLGVELGQRQYMEEAAESQRRLDADLRYSLQDLAFDGKEASLAYRQAVESLTQRRIHTAEDMNAALADLSSQFSAGALDAESFGIESARQALRNQFPQMDPVKLQDYLDLHLDLLDGGITSVADLLAHRKQLESEGRWPMSSQDWDAMVVMYQAFGNGVRAFTNTFGAGMDLDAYIKGNNLQGLNGHIPSQFLMDIGGGWKLLQPAAMSYLQMVETAKADGVSWDLGGAYRTYGSQANAYQQHLAGIKTANVKAPGTSEHGNGLAIDVAGKGAIAWLKANGARFGWYPISNEPWHFEFRGRGKANTSTMYTSGPSSTSAAPSPAPPVSPANVLTAVNGLVR